MATDNSLTAIMPKILARALMSLRTRCVVPRLVNGDYSAEAAKKGKTIDVPVPVAVTTTDVAPGAYGIVRKGVTPGSVSISLENWKQNNPIALSDKELCEIEASDVFLPMQLMEAIKALATDVNQEIIGHYKGASRGVFGIAGTRSDGFGVTPFDSSKQGVSGATLARKVLNEQLCPKTDRRGLVDFSCEANMLDLSQFAEAQKTMSNIVVMEGEIGRKYGIDWVADDDVPTHTAGTLHTPAGTLDVAADAAVGATSIDLESTSSENKTIKQGDIICFANDTKNSYVVKADATMSTTTVTVTIYPGLKTAILAADNVVADIGKSHVVNMAFHRDAFAFATRPLLDNSRKYALGSQMISMQDPITGLVLRLEVSRQHKQTVWEFDILWGSDLVRPELATRIIGKGS